MRDRPDLHAEELLAATRRLRAVIEKENERLASRRPHSISELVDDKSAAAAAFAKAMALPKKDPDVLKGADPAVLRMLSQETKTLRTALKENERAIARLRKISEGLIKAIADGVAAARAPALGYTQDARYAATKKPGTATAMTLNSVI
ncbi:MAG: hypothetical protein HXY22_06295 [Alphaproteobacteria bacterium]|nr:hypothetical protein [Alphaproteobacteria bacterium]